MYSFFLGQAAASASETLLMSGNPFDEGNKCHETVVAVRKRKGLKDGVPAQKHYYDKL